MKLFLYLREATRSLLSSLQRTLLALLGIIIGIASVIAMVSVGAIVKAEALHQFQELGTEFLVVTNLSDDAPGSSGGIAFSAIPALIRACPGVRALAPYSVSFGSVHQRGQSWSCPILGINGAFHRVNKLVMVEGRPLAEVDQGMYNCVVGDRIAEQIRQAGPGAIVGSRILVHGQMFTVVGVLKRATDNSLRPSEINDGVLVPANTVQRLVGSSKVSGFVARARKTSDIGLAVGQIRDVLAKVLKNREPFIQTADELIDQMNKQMNLLTMLLGIVGSIALVVGGVGVMNVMLVSVAERRREIGIRRALGARKRDIQGQFLIEAFLLCLIGGVAGIALGVGGSYVISRFQEWQFFASTEAITLGVGVSAMIGLFFGFYPAWQASRLRPIEALRSH